MSVPHCFFIDMAAIALADPNRPSDQPITVAIENASRTIAPVVWLEDNAVEHRATLDGKWWRLLILIEEDAQAILFKMNFHDWFYRFE